MSNIPSGIEPQVPEIPPFIIGGDDIEELKKKRTYSLTVKVRKTATNFHKVIHLDDGTDLDLTIKLTK